MADPLLHPARAPLAKGGAEEVGNKAWNLMRMAQAGLPVPPAFVLPTGWRLRTGPERDAALRQALADGIARLEAATGLASARRAGRCWCRSAPAPRCRCRA